MNVLNNHIHLRIRYLLKVNIFKSLTTVWFDFMYPCLLYHSGGSIKGA